MKKASISTSTIHNSGLVPFLVLISITFFFPVNGLFAQQQFTGLAYRGSDIPNFSVSPAFFSKVTDRISKLQNKVKRNLEKTLKSWEQKEAKIYRRLLRKDSLKAKEFQTWSGNNFLEKILQGEVGQLPTNGLQTPYVPELDTLTNAIRFLQRQESVPELQSTLMQSALSRLTSFESNLYQAENLSGILTERKKLLIRYLISSGLERQVKQFSKEAYYYTSRLNEYKLLLRDRSKREQKVVQILTQNRAFRDFMKKNSMLASMFRMPGDVLDPSSSLQGYQTRAQVAGFVQDKIISGGPDAQVQFQANMQAAQLQLNELKTAVLKSINHTNQVSISEGYPNVPDFKPNSQKTKSFLRRLEIGTNLQSQRSRSFFPVTTDLALSAGYKLNDKSIIGIGCSYKFGLGTGWDHIALTHQGVGLRSFVDYKIKGSFSISGGYEQNYRSAITSLDQMKDYSAWQTSGLLGVSKRYSVSKKVKGNIQLLWDFLSYQQIPRAQAVLFRVGYVWK